MSDAIDPAQPLTAEFRRIAGRRIDTAIAALKGDDVDPATGPHEARKSIKDLRALLRLVRPADEAFFRRENARYRDIAQSLAGVRAAAALVETVDRFIRDYPREAGAGGLDGIRQTLLAERNRLTAEEGDFCRLSAEAVAACEAGRAALDELDLPRRAPESADLLAEGMARVATRANKARKRARKSGDAAQFHEMRKSVKQHWAHIRQLSTVWPEHRRRRVKAAKRLGNRLGELHDIAVMRDLIASDADRLGTPEEIALFEALMDRKEVELEKKSLKMARRLFKAKPPRLARRVRRNYIRIARRARKPAKVTLAASKSVEKVPA